jgi:hypothetical protein
MAAPIVTSANMTDWLQVLDRIDASITRALDETAEYERALATSPLAAAVSEAEPPADAPLRGLRLHLDAAGRLVDAVEALLAADEGVARAWAGLADRAKARLAVPAGGIS